VIEHHLHASHPKVVSGLKRADGHLRLVVAMIEEGRSCLDVAKQMQVVEGNIRNAKRSLINDNMAHYLDGDPDREELKTIFRYL
jgi:DNA-binding FrmR family transcriptional regulator